MRFAAALFLLALVACQPLSKGVQQTQGADSENEDVSDFLYDLRKNGLVIVLHDQPRRVAYFHEKGMTRQLQEELAFQKTYHRNVVSNFHQYFTYAKPYFVYFSQLPALERREHVLLNDSLAVDPAIALPDKLFIAEFRELDRNEMSRTTERFTVRHRNTRITLKPALNWPWKPADQLDAKDVVKFNKIFKKGRFRQAAY